MNKFEEYFYNLIIGKEKGPVPGLLRGVLYCLSLVYGLSVIAIMAFYKVFARKLNCKVVSVGNITLGGTGKTTLVEYIARYLQQQGHAVAILSRGYKASGKPGKDDSSQALGDEPYMLKQKLANIPVIVDQDRIRGAKKAISQHKVDTVILDDGLQQWRIKKDLEIIAIDASNPFGNSRLLPAGFLRQPLGTLNQADLFLLTQVAANAGVNALRERLNRAAPRALIAESAHQPLSFVSVNEAGKISSLESFQARRAAVFCGIGNPQGFFDLLRSLGVKIELSFRFSDHYAYTQQDLDRIILSAGNQGLDDIITTEKDAVRLRGLNVSGCNLSALSVKLALTKNEAEFNRRLLKLYNL